MHLLEFKYSKGETSVAVAEARVPVRYDPPRCNLRATGTDPGAERQHGFRYDMALRGSVPGTARRTEPCSFDPQSPASPCGCQ